MRAIWSGCRRNAPNETSRAVSETDSNGIAAGLSWPASLKSAESIACADHALR